ncbi:MAG: hypothetical protein J6M53_05225 [Bacteroidaceae bacterium]|nr:hypothetical protein [Bacteroidaceae bacterium]
MESSIQTAQQDYEIYRLYRLEHQSMKSISAKIGISASSVWKRIHTFEASNPEISIQMQRQGKDVTPDKQLQAEVSRLQSELKREKLRADFYEEMVAFGKEVYGIDFKKAGTK